MWLFLKNSFLSIVDPGDQGPKTGDYLLVRARVKGDIERIFPRARVQETLCRDYRFRAYIQRSIVAKAISNEVIANKATNFKDSVDSNCRHAAYAGVWRTMWSFQNRLDGRTAEQFDRLEPEQTPLFLDDEFERL